MRFKPRLPNDTMTLLMLAVFIIVILGIARPTDDRRPHAAARSRRRLDLPAGRLRALAQLLPAGRPAGR